jgi:D-sedoheptulose 7-phosphate isomerase
VDAIQSYLDGLCDLLQQLSVDHIQQAIDCLLEACRLGRAVYIMGNGGSAATASHLANDLSKGTMVPGAPRFKAIALTDNIPLITAWANDTEYANIFLEQLRPLMGAGDVVIGISGSGNSENVLRAIKLAGERGATTIGWTGSDGGKLGRLVDVHLHAPGASMEMAEDVHMVLDHLMCTTIRQTLHAEYAAEAE